MQTFLKVLVDSDQLNVNQLQQFTHAHLAGSGIILNGRDLGLLRRLHPFPGLNEHAARPITRLLRPWQIVHVRRLPLLVRLLERFFDATKLLALVS